MRRVDQQFRPYAVAGRLVDRLDSSIVSYLRPLSGRQRAEAAFAIEGALAGVCVVLKSVRSKAQPRAASRAAGAGR